MVGGETVASKEVLKNRLEFRQMVLDELYAAYTELSKGRVQSYTIGSRSLTKFDLTKLMEEIREIESEVDQLSSLLNGGKRRKSIGVIPRDI